MGGLRLANHLVKFLILDSSIRENFIMVPEDQQETHAAWISFKVLALRSSVRYDHCPKNKVKKSRVRKDGWPQNNFSAKRPEFKVKLKIVRPYVQSKPKLPKAKRPVRSTDPGNN